MIKNIAVIGAGTMGHGIAEFFAMKGFKVNLYEPYEPVRKSVMDTIKSELEFLEEHNFIEKNSPSKSLDRIVLLDNLKDAVTDVDYIIEAAAEELEIKKALFKKMDTYCDNEVIISSNTSSLPFQDMIDGLSAERRSRFMICHWYNPAHLMPLVELSYFGNMPDDIFNKVESLYKKAGKVTIRVKKDVPGLVANRIQQGVAREVFSLIENEIAAPCDIEKALMFGPAFRYATTGQLEIADMGGLDIWCTVGDNLLSVMDNRREANPILREKVKNGKLGMKNGEGFFQYSKEDEEERKKQFYKKLILQQKVSQKYIDGPY